MPTWTQEQEEILRQYGNKGAEYCSDLIARVFHVERSAEATRRHASRLGILMVRHETCPGCGATVPKLNRNTGLCPTCNMKWLADQQRHLRGELERGCSDEDYKQARRDYDAQRKACQRVRNTVYGDFVDLSEKMSTRRSEP